MKCSMCRTNSPSLEPNQWRLSLRPLPKLLHAAPLHQAAAQALSLLLAGCCKPMAAHCLFFSLSSKVLKILCMQKLVGWKESLDDGDQPGITCMGWFYIFGWDLERSQELELKKERNEVLLAGGRRRQMWGGDGVGKWVGWMAVWVMDGISGCRVFGCGNGWKFELAVVSNKEMSRES